MSSSSPSPATARKRTAAVPGEAGFNHHLVKPVDHNALITLLTTSSNEPLARTSTRPPGSAADR